MSTKRSRIEVVYNILSLIKDNKNSIRFTPLWRKSKLSSKRFSEYLRELIEKEFVKEISDKKNKKYYFLTDKGFNYLKRYSAVKKLIEDFGL